MIDSAEFAEWLAAYKIKPWGDDWAQTDQLAYLICATSGVSRPKVGQFLPTQWPPGTTEELNSYPTTDQLVQRINAWLVGSGATVINGDVYR